MKIMKFCHVTALLLVGWYLLSPIPPPANPGPLSRLQDRVFGPASIPPMSEWRQLGAFDTARNCEAAKFQAGNSSGENTAQAICVASDDPRLIRN
jgi:hypothetical protein